MDFVMRVMLCYIFGRWIRQQNELEQQRRFTPQPPREPFFDSTYDRAMRKRIR